MLIVTRKSGYYVNSLRAYKIFLDNECVGKIRAGQEKRFEMNEGTHTVWLGIDGCRSRKITFEIKSKDDTIEIECWARSPFTVLFDIIFRSGDYIPAEIKKLDKHNQKTILQYETRISPEGYITLPPLPEYRSRRVIVSVDEEHNKLSE